MTSSCFLLMNYVIFPQDNVPPNSLKFFYGKKDKEQEHGAFAWLSVSPTVMNVTFVSRKGESCIELCYQTLSGLQF